MEFLEFNRRVTSLRPAGEWARKFNGRIGTKGQQYGKSVEAIRWCRRFWTKKWRIIVLKCLISYFFVSGRDKTLSRRGSLKSSSCSTMLATGERRHYAIIGGAGATRHEKVHQMDCATTTTSTLSAGTFGCDGPVLAGRSSFPTILIFRPPLSSTTITGV